MVRLFNMFDNFRAKMFDATAVVRHFPYPTPQLLYSKSESKPTYCTVSRKHYPWPSLDLRTKPSNQTKTLLANV